MKRTALGALLVAGLVCAAPASADLRPALPTIVQDDATFLHRSQRDVAAALDRLVALGVPEIRTTAQWSVLQPDPDPDAPDDDARYRRLDRLIRLADERGIAVLLDVGFTAPAYATTDAPGEARPRTRVDPAAFAAFAARIARRYDGARQGLGRVSTFSLWNEPNHNAFLLPQWRRVGRHFVPASPARYRRMVRAAYPAIKAIRPDAQVLIGGTSSEGSYSGRGAGPVPPLRFLRDLACVDRRLRPVTTGGCRSFEMLPGDGWTHHPYSLRSEPAAPAAADRPDDVPLGSLRRLTETLRRLVDAGRLAPGLAHVYITEYGYESNPPSTLQRWSMGDQARFLVWSEYLAWRNPAVKSFAQFLLRDTPPAARRVSPSLRRPYGEWGSGLFFADGTPKLAAVAFEAGLYIRRAAHGRVLVWGHLRVGSGPRTVRLEVRARPGSAWRPLVSEAVDAPARSTGFVTQEDGVFERVATAGPGTRLRLAYGAGLRTPSLSARAVNPAAPGRRLSRRPPFRRVAGLAFRG